jgi:hypothetical protein
MRKDIHGFSSLSPRPHPVRTRMKAGPIY